MTILIILVILAVIVYVLIKADNRDTNQVEHDYDIPPEIKITVSDTSTRQSPTLKPQKISEDTWILNPGHPFELTLSNINEEGIHQVKNILKEALSTGEYQPREKLIPVVARTNLTCKEIDDYIREFKPQYLGKIEDLKSTNSSEWNTAGERDKEDMLVEFRDKAIASLDVKPDCDIETLFECEPKDFTVDDILIDRYGYDIMATYLSYAHDISKVLQIPPDRGYRRSFEQLVKCDLAIRGTDIPTENILPTLTLKQMSALVSDLDHPRFTRKAKAIDFLKKIPDLSQRLQKEISFRELFLLKPLPAELSHIDLNAVSASWQYAKEVSLLLIRTFQASFNSKERHDDSQDELSFTRGWEVSTYDPCPLCERHTKQAYPKNNPPKAPFHIGCKCVVLAKYRD